MQWNQVLKQHLQELIRIDTTNPPGNETAAAEYIAKAFTAADIPYEIVGPEPGRGSIVARLKGDGSQRPLLLLSHLDVVPAVAADWTHPPFAGVEADGAIWGRGAIDIKNLAATWLTIMLRLKAEGTQLKRDVIFAATADEEAGGRAGLKWIVENRPELVDCEICLNEGGGNAVVLGGRTYLTMQSGEKSGAAVRLIAEGTGGHASIPLADNPLPKLGAALQSLGQARLPIHPTATVKAFVSAIVGDLGLGGMLGHNLDFNVIPGFIEQFVKNPFEKAGLYAMLSNTAVPTILKAGSKRNVIPRTAEAEVDGRLLPGQTADILKAEIEALMPAGVRVEVGGHLPATESDPRTPLAEIIAEVVPRHLSGAKVVPFLSPGSTDARYLRPRGVIVYGFDPMLPGERVDLAHGVDERITIKSLEFGLQVLHEVVERASGGAV